MVSDNINFEIQNLRHFHDTHSVKHRVAQTQYLRG